MRSESGSFAGRNMVSPAASEACADDVFAQAGIHDRRKEIDARQKAFPREIDGRGGLEPTRYEDWEIKGIACDF